MRRLSAFLTAIGALLTAQPLLAWPWVDAVSSYNPGPGQSQGEFRNPARLLGPPVGVSVEAPSPDSVVTLGDGGNVVLQFDDPIYDDGRNPHGLDFIVFSNAFWRGGDPAIRWQEPAFVEVSQDGVNWYLILPNILPAALKSPPTPNPDIGMSSTILRGYAEYTPTLPLPPGVRPEEFYTVPDRPSFADDPASLLIDEGSGGGDAMDIAWAVVETAPGVPALDGGGQVIPAHLDWVKYVRLTDAKTGDFAGVSGELSADIDAAAAVMPAEQSLGEARHEENERIVRIAQAIVTGVYPGGVFLQAPDRSSGLFATGMDAVEVGARLRVTGKLRHTADGSQIEVFFYDVLDTAQKPKALTVSLRHLNPSVGLGLDGLFVRTWGHVSALEAGRFQIAGEDGSTATVLTQDDMPPVGALVSVTAPVRVGAGGPALHAADKDDVRVLHTP
ncbi:MAG: hypothetical protein IT209_12620 [Armatimonadetes bacterium]|nr:hypothetical protein [Armatimonadota bacterium]